MPRCASRFAASATPTRRAGPTRSDCLPPRSSPEDLMYQSSLEHNHAVRSQQEIRLTDRAITVIFCSLREPRVRTKSLLLETKQVSNEKSDVSVFHGAREEASTATITVHSPSLPDLPRIRSICPDPDVFTAMQCCECRDTGRTDKMSIFWKR